MRKVKVDSFQGHLRMRSKKVENAVIAFAGRFKIKGIGPLSSIISRPF